MGVLGSILGPHLESDSYRSILCLYPDNYHRRVQSPDQLQRLKEMCDLALSGNQDIRLFLGTPSRKRSNYRSILWLYPDSYQDKSNRRISFIQLQEIYNITT
jgi:hypothetical protein